MTPVHDTAEPTPAQSAANPLGPRFWLSVGGSLALGAVIAALMVAVFLKLFGPALHKKPAAPEAASPAATSTEAQLRAEIAQLQQQLAQARQTETPAAAATSAEPALSGDAAAVLAARVDRLEQAQARAARAASAAVAAGALEDAAQTSRPFAGELAGVERLIPQSDLLAGLRPLAETGAPTRAALAAEFSDVAARAAAASHAPKKYSSLWDKAMSGLSSLVTIRRIDDLTGSSPDAALARAEVRVDAGDIEGALAQLQSLPPAGQSATADWREKAHRRLEIERRIAALRTTALRDLAFEPQAQPARPAGSL